MANIRMNRRNVIKGLAACAGLTVLPTGRAPATTFTAIEKPVPSSGEHIPVIGMGTWITFNVGDDPRARDDRAEVMRNLFAAGGSMIDSSPMYGSAQAVVGHGLDQLDAHDMVFSTDKVWTSDADEGAAQLEESRRLWGVRRFDLMQVHNLVAWRQHLPMLQEMKRRGELRYVGVTTSHGRRHGELERILATQDIDFVQLTYNILDREAETRLLPLAADRGVAVIANRPFRRGALMDRFEREPLPQWAAEIDCDNWAQFLLKFIVSHPDLTCAIPATTRVDHVLENMGAARGRMPDAAMRKRMVDYVESL